jgi:hypothetical protein
MIHSEENNILDISEIILTDEFIASTLESYYLTDILLIEDNIEDAIIEELTETPQFIENGYNKVHSKLSDLYEKI